MDPLAGGLGVWLGEYKGAPASVNLYTLRALRDVGNGSLPVTQAKKSFFKGDKVVLKWNKAGSMVSFEGKSLLWTTGDIVRRLTEVPWLWLNVGFVLDHLGCRQLGQVVLRRNQLVPDRSERAV